MRVSVRQEFGLWHIHCPIHWCPYDRFILDQGEALNLGEAHFLYHQVVGEA